MFLKYVSDAFDERRGQIQAELESEGMDEDQIAGLIDDYDEYTGRGVFFIPATSRWTFLAQNAKGRGDATIGQLIDDRRQAPARRAPGGPEIDQHDAVLHFVAEIRVRKRLHFL